MTLRLAKRIDATVAFVDAWVPQSVLFFAWICILVLATQFLPYVFPALFR